MNNNILVARVATGLNSINKDASISRRYILQVAISKATFLMAQKFRDRSLFRESNLYKTIECFEMEKIDKYTCDIVEFKSCNSVMRSVNKLPTLVYSRYGSSLKEVTNIDGSIEFKPSTPSKYRRDSRRQEFGEELFFTIKDEHLVIPESNVKRVSLYLYTPNSYDIEKANSCNEDKCLNPWDFELIASDKMMDIIVQETIKEVSMRLQITEDSNPNEDINQKGKTTN